MAKQIEITESAQEYLDGLLAKQNVDGIGVRVFVEQPGTPRAETCLAYCNPGDQQEDDVLLGDLRFPAYIESRSMPYLDEAVIDYAADRLGGQLSIKAPNSKMPKISEDSAIDEKVNYILWTEINPSLASHGGEVSLVEIAENNVAVLRFGGGCQGCSAVDITLKEGVEKTLLGSIPELAGVTDVTDHSDTSEAYYK
jgi:Fe/S biogenesis protein NfuA